MARFKQKDRTYGKNRYVRLSKSPGEKVDYTY